MSTCQDDKNVEVTLCQVKIFLKHIEKGVRLAQNNPESLLIFSG